MKKLMLSAVAIALTGALAMPALAQTATGGGTANGTVSGSAGTSGATVSGSGSASATTSGSVNLSDIDTQRPFGDLTFNRTDKPDQVDATLTDQQRQDLHDRCMLIGANQAKFDADTGAWCSSYMDWYKSKHPG